MEPIKQQHGWWREQSQLDVWDKRISHHVFALELGALAETLLLIPGTWLGLPISAFLLANLLTLLAMPLEEAALPQQEELLPQLMQQYVSPSHETNFFLLFAGALTAWSGFFFRHVHRDNILATYLANKRYMLPAMAMPVYVGGAFTRTAYKSACFFIAAWFTAQVVSSALKIAFARTRPMVSSSAKPLSSVRRTYQSVPQMLGVGESALESFPSGDTVGSAAFACTLYLLNVPHAWVLGALTGFCRMYFHAHHLLDVAVGFAIGWLVPLALHWGGLGLAFFDAWRLAGVVIVCLFIIVKMQRFKPQLPVHLRVEGRRGF